MTVEEQVQPGKNEASNLSIKDLFYKYIRFLPLFLISVALSLLVAYVYLRYATLVYQSAGTMVIQNDNQSGGSNDKLEQLLVSDGNKNIQNEIEYLRSRPLMERVVKSLNLNFSYFAQGNIKELNVYKSSPFVVEALEIADSGATFMLDLQFENDNSFIVNNESQKFLFGQVFKNKNGVFRLLRNGTGPISNQYHVIWRPTASEASRLLDDLVVAPKQGTGILVISKQATNPQLAADVINQLMKEYQEAVIEDKNDALVRTMAFVDTRLEVVQKELDSINRELLIFQQSNNLIDPQVQSSNYLTRIEAATQEISQQTIQLNNAEMLDHYLRTQLEDPVPSTLGIEDPTLTDPVISQYVSGFAFLANSFSFLIKVQSMAVFTNPTDLTGRIAHHQGIGRY